MHKGEEYRIVNPVMKFLANMETTDIIVTKLAYNLKAENAINMHIHC